jgi:5-formyltetrahydrofolate cyclo-ligase
MSDKQAMNPLKAALRQEMMMRRDQLTDRERRSAAIRAQILAMPAYAAARSIHCYLAMRSEVDTRALIGDAFTRGKQVVVPVVVPKAADLSHAWLASLDAGDLVAGHFGTFNPRDIRPALPGDWDLTIVPMLAFDRRGYRLGYGKGYYDRLLGATPMPTIGVAFAAQEVDTLPIEPYDVPLDCIVTEDEVILTSSGD